MYINSERTHDDACYAELTALSAEELWRDLHYIHSLRMKFSLQNMHLIGSNNPNTSPRRKEGKVEKKH